MSNYVYFAQCGTTVKIGISNNPLHRMISLRTGNPNTITLLRQYEHEDVEYIEKSLHSLFKDARGHGEWFSLPQPTLDLLFHIADAMGIEEAMRWFSTTTKATIDITERMYSDVLLLLKRTNQSSLIIDELMARVEELENV